MIYHADCADGFTAAWLLWKVYGDAGEYLPAVYGDTPAPVAAARGREVWVVDFSFPPEEMEALRQAATKLCVCDHHQSAVARLLPWAAGLPEEDRERVVLDVNRSGARIVWQSLREAQHDGMRHHGMEELVRYTEDRDLWRWDLPGSKAINAWIGGLEQTLDVWSAAAEALGDPEIRPSAMFAGTALLDAARQRVAAAAARSVPLTLDGHAGRVVNATADWSEVGEALATVEGSAFGAVWHVLGDGRVKVSFRSRPKEGEGPESALDVADLAETWGGGGHRQAASCVLEAWEAVDLLGICDVEKTPVETIGRCEVCRAPVAEHRGHMTCEEGIVLCERHVPDAKELKGMLATARDAEAEGRRADLAEDRVRELEAEVEETGRALAIAAKRSGDDELARQDAVRRAEEAEAEVKRLGGELQKCNNGKSDVFGRLQDALSRIEKADAGKFEAEKRVRELEKTLVERDAALLSLVEFEEDRDPPAESTITTTVDVELLEGVACTLSDRMSDEAFRDAALIAVAAAHSPGTRPAAVVYEASKYADALLAERIRAGAGKGGEADGR